MTQFTAYANSNPVTQKQYSYLLDIQSDLLSELKTTVVIPLSPAKLVAAISLSRLNPALTLNGEQLIAMTLDLAGIDRAANSALQQVIYRPIEVKLSPHWILLYRVFRSRTKKV